MWEGAKARTAFPQSRPELAPAAAVGGFCGGAPCPDGIQFLVPDLLGPGQSTSLLSAGGGGMSFFAASAQPISSDLPYQRPIPRKVLRFCRGPSMLEADFMEGQKYFLTWSSGMAATRTICFWEQPSRDLIARTINLV